MAQPLSNLPVGAKVKFGKHRIGSETPWDISWMIVAKNHTGYPADSVTLLTEKSVDTLAYDAAEPTTTNDQNRRWYGNNRYYLSNIDQWLNSPEQSWYKATHALDAPPSAANIPSSQTAYAYDTRCGFLFNFSQNERLKILDTTIRVVKSQVDGGGYDDIARKVFLPSATEVRNMVENNVREGTQWEWFALGNPVTCPVDPTARANGASGNASPSDNWSWRLRTPSGFTESDITRRISEDGSYLNASAYYSLWGIRPALNLPSTLKVSDTMDASGYYTFVWNAAPYAPASLGVPTIYGGRVNAISWSAALDPDGDAIEYVLECKVDGGEFTTLYRGTALNYGHLLPYGATSVVYRVKAVDSNGESSLYNESATISVINNKAPVISGSDRNLGTYTAGFGVTYTVTDSDTGATLVATEAIDGVTIRTYNPTSASSQSCSVRDNTWLSLSNGVHTITITVSDGIDTTVRTLTFTKSVDTIVIENSTPWAASTRPTRIMLVVTRNLPAGATFTVNVCNNGNDSSPVWEDCTDAVRSGLVHVFTNKSKTATNWGVKFMVTVSRNGASGMCYVSAIGGNFE